MLITNNNKTYNNEPSYDTYTYIYKRDIWMLYTSNNDYNKLHKLDRTLFWIIYDFR